MLLCETENGAPIGVLMRRVGDYHTHIELSEIEMPEVVTSAQSIELNTRRIVLKIEPRTRRYKQPDVEKYSRRGDEFYEVRKALYSGLPDGFQSEVIHYRDASSASTVFCLKYLAAVVPQALSEVVFDSDDFIPS